MSKRSFVCRQERVTQFRKPLALSMAALLVTLLMVAVPAGAEKATLEEMNLVSRNWLSSITYERGSWAGAADPLVETEENIVENDTLLGRVYHVSPRGYIVVPALKEMPPVKMYSEMNNLDMTAPDGPAQLIREVLLHRTRQFVDQYGSMDAVPLEEEGALFDGAHRAVWDRLAISRKQFVDNLSRRAQAPMQQGGPLLTTSWHQHYPYNTFCPYGDGASCLVGCVATATAQILAYWKWPDFGFGSHTYYWQGDYSCGGSTSGEYLSADYSDEYDWDNIVDNCDGGCSLAERNALSELCYEVGVAFEMNYGVCGSGAYTSDAQIVFPTYFGYSDEINRQNRSTHTVTQWFSMVQDEINGGRPIQYRINRHSIVCDGWRIWNDLDQMHLNYGWDDGHTTWYTVDNLYCPWDGCTPMVEYMIRQIMPFNTVSFEADVRVGQVPLEVRFTASSDLSVELWTWNFGDGDSAAIQNPDHSYDLPGVYDVTVEVMSEGETYSSSRTEYIAALADTLVGMPVEAAPGEVIEVVIRGRNVCPLRVIKVPVVQSGTMTPTLDSLSTTGCRTEYFDNLTFLHWDGFNGKFTIEVNAGLAPELLPGEGDLVKMYFTLPESVGLDDTLYLDFGGYTSGPSTYSPQFVGHVALYEPATVGTAITVRSCCVGITGNVDGDPEDQINIVDLNRLSTYLFGGNHDLPCPAEANIDGDPEQTINLVDLTMLVAHLFGSGSSPASCP